MLQIKNISKKYVTGDLVQTALNDVSFNLRDNEFVAVLGQSGSGKTTLLNVIGGLDRYDSGDLVINDVSTKKYNDRDWDSYRNHTIGFVFQSYNLIPHQSVLSNVELALTISGISKSERRKKAKEALEKVGLGDQLHKKPNQMSGGQMQRVAIARALVNDPEILLADEPTGALDSETSVQVMDLLKEVAKDRLVVLVTHNNELADAYANRIIKLSDGKIIDDTNPFSIDKEKLPPAAHKNMGKTTMSFPTALSLSFNNLRTKMGRTLLTAFAGSIGIIGIALILSLSTGVNQYVEDIQKSTMLSYPITIDAQTIDLSSMIAAGREATSGEADHELDGVYSNSLDIEMASTMFTSVTENNLTDFKKYLDNPDSEIHDYLGENGVIYSYDVQFGVFTYDPEGALVNTDGVVIEEKQASSGMMSAMSGMMMYPSGNFEQMLPGKDGALVSSAVTDSYDMVYGSWPQSYDEVVLVLDQNNEVSLTVLYELGLLPAADYTELMDKLTAGEEVDTETVKWSYDEIAGQVFYMIPESDQYVLEENGTYSYIGGDAEALAELTDGAVQLKISGIIRPAENAENANIYSTIGYTKALTDHIIEASNSSDIVKAQAASTEINVLNGMKFSPSDDSAKIEDATVYLESLNISQKAALFTTIMRSVYAGSPESMEMMTAMGEQELAAMMDSYLLEDPDPDVMLMIYNSYISAGTYDENMSTFGMVSLDAPSSISIYADSFEDKDNISAAIDAYNETASQEDQISYTDYVGLLMSSVTTIINVITYVLIAFVGVSLVVSSIMIGIITYISVLERTKEIGVLRAIGASKRNISQVFNAETFIVGLCAGVIGVGVTLLLLIPANAIIHAVTASTAVNAVLPIPAAGLLIALSMVLTLIAGLIPSKQAANKDPVTALRSE